MTNLQHAREVIDALAYRPPHRPTPCEIGGTSRMQTAPVERTFPPLDEGEMGTAPSAPGAGRVVLVCGDALTPEPVRWLWNHWLALGKLHILAGAPGQGKTTIALAMAATVTIGGRWPDGSRSDKGNILVWSGEDDPADTLLPRLLASGADRSRCHFIQGTRADDGSVQPFDPSRDLAALRSAIAEIGGVRLLVVDPVVGAVTGDSHKNTEVRRALQPLVDLAAACDCAVLGITHFAKGGQGVDPAQRVVGSVAFTAVARVVLVAAKVKSDDGEDKRILARSKSNIGPDDGGFEYHLEQREPLPGIPASCIAWGKAVDGTARELLTDPGELQQDESDAATAKDAAIDFLVEVLKEGSAPSNYVKAEAKEAGISWATVRRAADAIGIKKRKSNDAWYWLKPNLLKQGAQDAQPLNVEQVEHLDEQLARKHTEECTKVAKGARFKNVHSSHSSVHSSAETEDSTEDSKTSEDSYFGNGESSAREVL